MSQKSTPGRNNKKMSEKHWSKAVVLDFNCTLEFSEELKNFDAWAAPHTSQTRIFGTCISHSF